MPTEKIFFSLRKKTASHSQSCPMPPCELFCQWCVIVPKKSGLWECFAKCFKGVPLIHYSSSHRPSRNSKLPIWPFNSAAKSYLAGESHVSYPGSPSWLQRGYLLLIAWHQYLACSNDHVCFYLERVVLDEWLGRTLQVQVQQERKGKVLPSVIATPFVLP